MNIFMQTEKCRLMKQAARHISHKDLFFYRRIPPEMETRGERS